MNSRKKPLNTTIDDDLREKLRSLADANGMTISSLLRWLGTKALDSPERFGLLPNKKVTTA